MQQFFLSIPQDTWNIFFLVTRYVVVALILAYLVNVYVKRKNIHTDIKGRVLEWRVETYKSIHRWVMRFQSVIAAPSQDEKRYENILALTGFKIGYQGMEYTTFFDTPERLLKFCVEFDQMLNAYEGFVDYLLRHELNSLQYWLDDVVTYYGAFEETECDERWKFSDEKVHDHCELASKVLGIALQEDVNRFYHKIDEMLRDRLRNVKIAGVYSESWLTKGKRYVCDYCESVMDEKEDCRYVRMVEWFYYHVVYRYYGCRTELHTNKLDLMTIFILIHFEEQFEQDSDLWKDETVFRRMTTEFSNCFTQYLK